ncbi:hypothetical protein CDEN61S_01745 [Castellaniella denitrificans]
MRLDLDRIGVLGQPQAAQDPAGERGPVDFRVGRQVGIVVAGGAVHLGQGLHGADRVQGALQAGDHVGEFLAHGTGRGRLAVRARQQRLIGVPVRQFAQAGGDRFQGRHHAQRARPAQHQGVRGVVDVFRRAGEVDEFGRPGQFGVVGHLFLEPVFHRLHVVVGGALDGLDAGRVGLGEIVHQRPQPRARRRREGGQLGQAGVGQADQPGDLDFDPVRHEAGFGQEGPQGVGLGRVAPIQGRQRVQRAEGRINMHHRREEKARPPGHEAGARGTVERTATRGGPGSEGPARRTPSQDSSTRPARASRRGGYTTPRHRRFVKKGQNAPDIPGSGDPSCYTFRALDSLASP